MQGVVFFFGVKKEPRSLDCSAPPARLRMTGVTQTPNPGVLDGAGQDVNSDCE